ncbi:MAG: DinB family protein [Bacteroidota bacterium]
MRTTTATRLDTLDKQLESWLSELDTKSHAQVNQPGKDAGWSAMQCMHHLLLSETYALQYLQKKLSYDPKIAKTGLKHNINAGLLRLFFMLPMKYRAPQMIATDKLPPESDFNETAQLYRDHRSDFRRWLADLDPKWFDRAAFKHPFIGRMSINHMISFFKWHFARHQKQGNRAIPRSINA